MKNEYKKMYLAITISLVVLLGTLTSNTYSTNNELETLNYYVEVRTSLNVDENQGQFSSRMEEELAKAEEYIENYTITFYDDNDNQTFVQKAKDSKMKGSIVLGKDAKIKINTKEIFPNSLTDSIVELPVFPDKSTYKDMINAQKNGNRFILRSISVNTFFTKKNQNHEGLLKKSDVNFSNSISTKTLSRYNSEFHYFDNMYACVFVYDQYNSTNTRKRNRFVGYHRKYSNYNGIIDGANFVSTSSYDSRDDGVVLAWNVGGAIGLHDSSRQLSASYNLQCENCVLNGNTNNYTSTNLREDNSLVTKHDTAFTGTCTAYNIPDRDVGFCGSCGWGQALYPSNIQIKSTSGWYDVGGYWGANGEVRTEYIHTWQNRSLSLTPSIPIPPGSIGISISGVTEDRRESSWVFAEIDPN